MRKLEDLAEVRLPVIVLICGLLLTMSIALFILAEVYAAYRVSQMYAPFIEQCIKDRGFVREYECEYLWREMHFEERDVRRYPGTRRAYTRG